MTIYKVIVPNNKYDLSATTVAQVLSYNESTGIFTWKHKTSPGVKANSAAGYKNPKGYITIRIGGREYRAAKIAWLLKTGNWPPADVDHKNTINDDNRWDNLRLATVSENNCNKPVLARSTTGLKGVIKDSKSNKFRAKIQKDGVRFDLGCFDTAEEAHAAYREAAAKLHGEFARF